MCSARRMLSHAARITCVPELLQDGKEGFIVQSGLAEPLSEAMMTLLKDADLRRTMAEAALRTRENFNVSAVVRVYEKLYDEISDPFLNLGPHWGHIYFGRKSTATGEDLGA